MCLIFNGIIGNIFLIFKDLYVITAKIKETLLKNTLKSFFFSLQLY